MASSRIKGTTIEIDGDTTTLGKTLESAGSYGIMGLVMGMFNLTASGICSAIIFSFFLSMIFKPRD